MRLLLSWNSSHRHLLSNTVHAHFRSELGALALLFPPPAVEIPLSTCAAAEPTAGVPGTTRPAFSLLDMLLSDRLTTGVAEG